MKCSFRNPTRSAVNIIFHAICLSGLIWQLCEVSVNYFKYNVVSDIKVIMPQNDNYVWYFHFCNTMSNSINFGNLSEYSHLNIPNIWKEKYNFERFNLSLKQQFDLENRGLDRVH